MPATVPVPTKSPGDVLTSALWNTFVAGNLNKLLNQGHRVLTVAQFAALTSPEDGDEVYLEVDGTNGVLWHLRYVAAEPTYKWRYLGGPPMVSEVTTSETTTSTTYAALTTAGPSVAVPRGGDFDVAIEFSGSVTSASQVWMSYDIGGTGAADADAAHTDTTVNPQNTGRRRRKTALTAATLLAKYKVTGAVTGTFKERMMQVRPVRLI